MKQTDSLCSMRMKVIGIVLVALSAIAIYAGVVYHQKMRVTATVNGIYFPSPKQVNDFLLVDNAGQPFTKTA